jgi:beta-xylosidase
MMMQMKLTHKIPDRLAKRRKACALLAFLSLQITFTGTSVLAQNPVIRDIYTADPSAHVWPDGRLYLYPSHDIDPPQGCDLMDKYHVYSTDDMVHWTDHGEVLQANQVSWGRPEGGFMWAPDCAYKNGIYYLYFPHPSATEWNNSWKIGVATSTKPASDFTVQGYIQGLKPMIDPCVFVDDDGQAYFYYGGGGHCEGGKLKDNMIEIEGQMKEMQGLVDFHEATWVHKYNGLYYLSYSDNNGTGGNQMRYATSNSPLGPWTYRGIYIKPTGSSTNHGSIVEYKGQSYAFYHTSLLSGNDWLRSVCVDSLFYDADGTIQLVKQTREHGTPFGSAPVAIPGTIETENYDRGGQGIAFSDNDVVNSGNQSRMKEAVDIENSSTGGFNVGWTNAGEWLEYTVNVTENSIYTLLTIAASPNKNSSIRLKIDGNDIAGPVIIPNTGGWQSYDTITTTNVRLKAGTHIIQLFEETGGFNIDKIIFEKGTVTSSAPPLNKNKNYRIFPNPASAEVIIETSEQSPVAFHCTIFDLQGKMIKTAENKTDKNRISVDVRGINAGCYLIKIFSGNNVETRKLLIINN